MFVQEGKQTQSHSILRSISMDSLQYVISAVKTTQLLQVLEKIYPNMHTDLRVKCTEWFCASECVYLLNKILFSDTHICKVGFSCIQISFQ